MKNYLIFFPTIPNSRTRYKIYIEQSQHRFECIFSTFSQEKENNTSLTLNGAFLDLSFFFLDKEGEKIVFPVCIVIYRFLS